MKGPERTRIARLWKREVLSHRGWQRHALFLLAAIAIGVVAWYFQVAEREGDRWFSFLRGESAWLDGGWRMPEPLATVLPMLWVTLSMLLIVTLRDRYFRGTEGTGIPQTIATLKTSDVEVRDRMLSGRILIGKILLLTIGLFSGMTLGREGPSVHVGAALMHMITKWVRFPRHLVRRGLILGGGGAGIAAAFNAPLAGLVFSFEEIARSFEKNNVGTVIRSVIISSVFIVVVLGKDYLFYGQIHSNDGNWTLGQWASIFLIGTIGGFLGGGFAQCTIKGSAFATRCMKWNRWLTPLALGAGLGVAGYLSDGESYGSGYQQTQQILLEGVQYPWYFAPLTAVASFLTLASGIPGGLFDPSLTVGAGLGQSMLPVVNMVSPGLDPESVIMMFMVAYFAGVVQSPITCAIIMVEMTAARHMTLPLLGVAVIAYECSRLVCRTSLYEALANTFLAGLSKQSEGDKAPSNKKPEPSQSK
ncbi:chloride channel protein [Rubripirellula sp.]|nr:chloride channel protein [Rubripirellula sp.]MDB4621244.1 chloride channel protein [Rubripirellula sp.]